MLREAERCELGLFSNGRSAVLSVPVGVINFGRAIGIIARIRKPLRVLPQSRARPNPPNPRDAVRGPCLRYAALAGKDAGRLAPPESWWRKPPITSTGEALGPCCQSVP